MKLSKKAKKNAVRPANLPKKNPQTPPKSQSVPAKSVAQVNYNAPPKTVPAPKDHYAKALLFPFSMEALGARVPDQYFSPTATFALREFATLTSDASGNLDLIAMPNPLVPAWSTRSNVSNGTTMVTPDGTIYPTAGFLNSSTSLGKKLKNYRIVSWGMRVRNTSSMTNVSGVVTTALVPSHFRLKTPYALEIGGNGANGAGASNLTIGNWLGAAGIPFTGSGTSAKVDTSSLLDLPFHSRYPSLQLAEQGIEVRPKLVDPSGLLFRNATDSFWGEDMQATTSAIYVQPGDASYTMCDGWTNIVLAGNGFPANTSVMDVELIYHLEGSPNVDSGTLFIADTPVVKLDPIGAMIAIAGLNRAQPFVKIASEAMRAMAG